MKKLNSGKNILLLPVLVILLLIYAVGCSDNNVIGPVNNSVAFQMFNQPGSHGGTEFLFKPSLDVKVNEVVSSLPPFYDTVVTTSNYTFSKDTFYVINEFQNVSRGQQWNFQFFGTVISTNAGYVVTTSYTVP